MPYDVLHLTCQSAQHLRTIEKMAMRCVIGRFSGLAQLLAAHSIKHAKGGNALLQGRRSGRRSATANGCPASVCSVYGAERKGAHDRVMKSKEAHDAKASAEAHSHLRTSLMYPRTPSVAAMPHAATQVTCRPTAYIFYSQANACTERGAISMK